MDKDLPIT